MNDNFAGTPENAKTVGITPPEAQTFTVGVTHDELLKDITDKHSNHIGEHTEIVLINGCRTCEAYYALRAVVELHKPFQDSSGWWHCNECDHIGDFGCPTFKAIEKELG